MRTLSITLPGSIAAAAHDRVDRLLLGNGRAARRRVLRLLAPAATSVATAEPQPRPRNAPKSAATARVEDIRGRVGRLLVAAPVSSDLAA